MNVVVVRLSETGACPGRRSSRAALPALLLCVGLIGCGPEEGKDEPASSGTGGAGASSAGGTAATGGTGSGGGATGGSGAVVDDASFTLGEPQTLASGQPVPVRLVLMGDEVYFANRGLDDQATGAIMSVSKNGGTASVFAGGLAYVSGLAAKGTDTLVYTTYGLASSRQGSMVIHPLDGTLETTSSVDYPYEPSFSDDAFYLFRRSELIRAPLGAESSTLVALVSPRRRWHEGGRIYITVGRAADPATGELRVWSESEPDAPVLSDTLARPEGVVMAQGKLYVTCPGDGTVVRIDPTSGASETVASGYVAPWGVAADSVNVYFADRGAPEDCVAGDHRGAIARIPLSGGPAENIASGLPCPSTIAVDATGIYWADNGTTAAASDGTVMKIPKLR